MDNRLARPGRDGHDSLLDLPELAARCDGTWSGVGVGEFGLVAEGPEADRQDTEEDADSDDHDQQGQRTGPTWRRGTARGGIGALWGVAEGHGNDLCFQHGGSLSFRLPLYFIIRVQRAFLPVLCRGRSEPPGEQGSCVTPSASNYQGTDVPRSPANETTHPSRSR